MRYQAFSRDCKSLGIRTQDFEDVQELALALEMSVDPGNARQVVRLLAQMASDDFDLSEARRTFSGPLFEERAWKIRPWTSSSAECSFFCPSGAVEGETERFERWFASLPSELRAPILAFFEAEPRRFILAADPLASRGDRLVVKLGVQDAALELSYFLPELFDLRLASTGRDLLRHLRIGTLYHEILTTAGLDAGRILALLGGESSTRELTAPVAIAES